MTAISATPVGSSSSPGAGLEILEAAAASPATSNYPQLHAVRAHLLSQLGRHAEAADHYRQAAGATRNAGERTTFLTWAESEVAPLLRDSGSGGTGPDSEFTQ